MTWTSWKTPTQILVVFSTEKHLNNSKIHLNRHGDQILENNMFSGCRKHNHWLKEPLLDSQLNKDFDHRSSFEIDGTPRPNVSGNRGPAPGVKLGFRKGMVIASLNVSSLPAHKDDVETLLKDKGIHILALNETKIDDSYPSDLLQIDGYRFVRHDRNPDGGD